jgi:hypothetical protein
MIKEWDLNNTVVPYGTEIENTQPTASRSVSRTLSSLIRCAVVITTSSLAASAFDTPLICSVGATSQSIVVLNRLKVSGSRTVRLNTRGDNIQNKDFARARTSSQLAGSFRSMLRPIPSEEDVDSDYTFG